METTDAFRARFAENYYNLLIKKGVDPSTARTRAKAKAAALPARIETPAAAPAPAPAAPPAPVAAPPVFRAGAPLCLLYGQFRRVSRDGAQLQLHDDDLTALVDGDPMSRPRSPVPLRKPVAQVPVARPQVHLRDGAGEVPEASRS